MAKRLYSLFLALLMLAIYISNGNQNPLTGLADEIDKSGNYDFTAENIEKDAETYADYMLSAPSFPNADKDILIEIDSKISNDTVEASFTVPEDGLYTLGFSYYGVDKKTNPIKAAIQINGEYLFNEMSEAELPRFWKDDGKVRMDGQGNEFSPEQLPYQDYITHFLSDTSGIFTEPYKVALEAGTHKISITPINGEFNLKHIILGAPEVMRDYDASDKPDLEFYKGKEIVIEGEKALYKNNYWLVSLSDISSPNVSPADPIHTKVNYIGGSNWKHTGDTIAWNVDITQAGYYQIGFSYRQNLVLNGSTYRWLKIDGKTPFKQAQSIAFPYSSDWKTMVFSDSNNNPYLIYLDEGTHQISLTATLGEYTNICSKLNDAVSKLGSIYVDITMITGESVDIYRDYQLFNQIPNFNARLQDCYDFLMDINRDLSELSGEDASSYAATVKNMAQVIKLMLENQYTAHRYKSNYYNSYCSLSACLNEMKDMPLDIDQIVLAPPFGQIKDDGKVSQLFSKIWFSIRRLVASFTVDYNNISGSTDTDDNLTVWVNWGRDQAQILNMLIQSSFINKHNISVSVKISNASIVQAVLSGKGPDCILQQSRTEPLNLAIRGALLDLTEFEDCEQVLERFMDGAAVPYYYKDGLYALPDTQTFFMMFYRTDIFKQLELQPPKTWDEFREVVKALSRKNLQAWLPYIQLTDLYQVNMGIGGLNLFPSLLMQNGLPLYTKDLRKTTLTDPAVISVFKSWTDFYTKDRVPYTMDFYNRFRIGTCPIGINSYTLYNTLKAAAPEIEGNWAMTEIPGTYKEDGSISHASAGGGTGCAILSSTKNKDAAWKFLKWWTSSDTQLAFSNNLEAILGPIGRVSVSNVEALSQMSWDNETYKAVVSAWENVQELPEVPGGYYVARSIDYSFWNAASLNKNPKDMLIMWGEDADDEIQRKWRQYENR